MCLAPTFGEVAFWVAAALASAVLLIRGLASSSSNGQIDDLAAWQRNYDRMQRRNR